MAGTFRMRATSHYSCSLSHFRIVTLGPGFVVRTIVWQAMKQAHDRHSLSKSIVIFLVVAAPFCVDQGMRLAALRVNLSRLTQGNAWFASSKATSPPRHSDFDIKSGRREVVLHPLSSA